MRRSTLTAAAVFMTLACLLAGCPSDPGTSGTGGGSGGGNGTGGGGGGGGGTSGVLDKPHSTTGNSWTVLVYVSADNDLEPFAVQDLNEMMQVGSKTGFNLVAQVDRAQGYSSDEVGGLGDFTSTKRVVVRQGSLEEVADLGEVDMADPASLADFIKWGLTTYPADRTALVFWDHGGGWRGFGVDEASGGKLLSVPAIVQGVSQGRQAANAKPFNIIGFDACLMATYEVALSLAPHGEYLLASEEVEPGHGWNWASLSVVAQTPSTDPVALGSRIIEGFQAQAQEAGTADSVTLSFVDLYRMGTLSDAVGAVIASYNASPGTLTTSFGRGQEGAVKFGEAPDPSQSTNMVDLLQMVVGAEQDAKSAGLTAAKQKLSDAIGAAVVKSAAGPARAKATGLAVYFPPSSQYYGASYDAIAAAEQWRAFLKAYFQGGTSVGTPTFTNANSVADTTMETDGWHVVGTLSAGSAPNIAKATLLGGLVSTDAKYLWMLGDLPATVTNTDVTGVWDLTVLTLTQGNQTTYGYSNIEQVDATHVTLNILFSYRASSNAAQQTCLRQLVIEVNGGTSTLTSDTYYVANNGAFGELTPAAGSELMPLIIQYDVNANTQQYVAASDTPFTTTTVGGKPTFDLKLQFSPLKTGDKAFALVSIENSAGKGDAVFATTTIQ